MYTWLHCIIYFTGDYLYIVKSWVDPVEIVQLQRKYSTWNLFIHCTVGLSVDPMYIQYTASNQKLYLELFYALYMPPSDPGIYVVSNKTFYLEQPPVKYIIQCNHVYINSS